MFPLLLLVMLGIMDFGFLFQRYEVVTTAAREGARVAILPGYQDADVRARVNAVPDGRRTDRAGNRQRRRTAGAQRRQASASRSGPVTVSYDLQISSSGRSSAFFGEPALGTRQLNATVGDAQRNRRRNLLVGLSKETQ